MWMTLIFNVTAVLIVGMTLSTLWHVRWVRRLPSLKVLADGREGQGAGRICVSIVVAARDEEARIEQTIRHLLAQCGVEIEIIIVNDRSTDSTGAILERMSKLDARIHMIQVEVLPEKWLGKCYACYLGGNAATHDWILFTDADCWLAPDAIARAVRLAERDRVDHVTMSPGTHVESVWTQAWHLLFLTTLANWFSGVNRDRAGSYMGIGAFNLVRASAYRQCGGYEALRLTVLDDMKLGLLLRRAGKKTRAFLGVDDVRCHWGNTVAGMVKVMEKNYFAAVEYRVWLVALGSLFVILVFSTMALGLVTGRISGVIAALSPFSSALPGIILARRLGWSWPAAVCMPAMFPVFWYALLNSMFVTLRQGGIRWRETFYSLRTLRAGTLR
jgi:glycosyltransferase involved in cell wall biosynthesis